MGSKTIPPKLTLPFKSNIPQQENPISLLNTVPIAAIRPEGIELQRQDTFINQVMEDIALRSTIVLPSLVLEPKKQEQLDQRQVIASTAGGAAIIGIGDIVSTALRYLMNVTMTHILSQAAYGIFVEAFTAVSIIGFAGNVGLDSTILRFLPIYRVKGEHGFAVGLIRFALWMTLIAGLLCGVLFFLFSGALAHYAYHSDAYELPFKEAVVLIPLIALQQVLARGLQAFKAVKWKVYVDRLIQPGLTLILIGVFYLLGLRLEGVMLATAVGFLACTIVGHYLLGKAAKQFVADATPRFEVKAWLCFSLPMFAYSMIQSLSNTTDVLFLAAFATPAQVGLYGAADRASVLVLMPCWALSTILSPLIAEYHTRGERTDLAKMLKVVTKWSFSLSLPVFLCFCVFHQPILNVFSNEYTAGGTVLMILSFGNLAYAGAGLTLGLLAMTGRPLLTLANTVVAIAVNLGLAFLLVPRFGAVGAAVVSAMMLIVLSILGVVEVTWIIKISPYRWDLLKPVAAGGAASGIDLLLLQLVRTHGGRLAMFEALALIIPFMLIYVVVLALLRFSEEDMIVVDAIRTRLGRRNTPGSYAHK